MPLDYGTHEGIPWEIWWFAADLRAPDSKLGVEVMFKKIASGAIVVNVAVANLETGVRCWRTEAHDMGVEISSSSLEVLSPEAQVRQLTEGEFHLRGVVDEHTSFDLTLRVASPVLHSAGTACIPFNGGHSWQFSYPSLQVDGTVTVEGATQPVDGGGWFDRQWCDSAVDFASLKFSWLGVCLDNGTNISLWDFTPGKASAPRWATIVDPDGSHVIVVVEPVADSAVGSVQDADGNQYPAEWTVSIPSADAVLKITHHHLFERPGQPFYQGVLRAQGTWKSLPVRGFGFCDLVGWTSASAGDDRT